MGATEMSESDANNVKKEMTYREKAKGLDMCRGRARGEIRTGEG